MYKISHESKGLVSHGVSACAGCGLELIMRNVMDVVGEDTVIVIPPGCSALFSGFCNETNLKIAGIQMNLENSAACAAGIRAGLKIQGNDHTTVLVFAGDGATVDIGIQSLSGAMERNDRILYICYDNEAYMNTGIQSSSSTPLGASTTTTPAGKNVSRKNLIGIAMAHNVPYAATASLQNLVDLRKKVQKAKETDGTSVLHIHTPCPTGWFYDPKYTIKIARMAVNTGSWILYEWENGKVTINHRPKELEPIEEYIRIQGRFKHLKSEQIEIIREEVKSRYEEFLRKNA
jgi:pyruvate/2-oxoacid:ferredoxin oxidoreductase beta subunit